MEEKKENLLYCTLEECEKVFVEFIEPNIDHYAESKDKLSILRICVELLNRLEGSPKHQMAGRVLLFLAKILGLFDQSGLNPRSEFNYASLPDPVIQNIKRIEEQNVQKDKNFSKLANHDMEEGETISDDDSNDSKPQEDVDKIYERFWKVQESFNNPNRLYDKNAWFTFRTHVDTLIYRIENKPATTQVWDLKCSYMVDPKALTLQLNDVYTRRSFLLQILIALQYLEMPVDTRPETYVLDKSQISWISSTLRRIYVLLDSMPSKEEGRRFLDLVRMILAHEEMWNRWKNNKCKPPKELDNPSDVTEEDDMSCINMRGTYHKIRKISNELSNAKPYKMHVVGSPDMYRLWNMKEKELNNDPDLAKYLNIPAEKQAELFKSPNYSYRLFRLLRKSPFFFIPTSAAIQSLDGYLRETTKNFGNSNQANTSQNSCNAVNSVA